MIYFPLSARVLTAGHVKCLEFLAERDYVIAGLLTAEAMEGYKDEVVPYEDRKYILDKVAEAIGRIQIMPQNSLDPSENLEKTGCNYIASGDGWEEEELQAIKELGVTPLDIVLDGEKEKEYSSSEIIEQLCAKE